MKKVDFKSCEIYAARLAALRPLPAATLKSLREYYRVGLTYTSNALEGNSLTESETKVVIEDGLTIGGKPLRDIYEATGHARAYDFLYEISKERPVSESDILELHRLFYSQIDKDNAGVWRKVPVFISGSHRALPAPEKVPSLMAGFVKWMAENEGKLHPVEFAALVHQKFVYIHPFVDGNGRMARLLMNLALLRAGWTIAIIPPICRHDYIATLDKAGRSPTPFVLFVRDRIIETQRELLRLMGQSIAIGDEGVNAKNDEGVNEGVNLLLLAITRNPGKRANELATYIGRSVQSVERYVRVLKDAGKIEFRGAPKNGGYYAV
ncbi:MAG: Fic family protein [Kiritimatiellae bacterium]|nr:Fic family protein [Kiritimatiellia bacterium]